MIKRFIVRSGTMFYLSVMAESAALQLKHDFYTEINSNLPEKLYGFQINKCVLAFLKLRIELLNAFIEGVQSQGE